MNVRIELDGDARETTDEASAITLLLMLAAQDGRARIVPRETRDTSMRFVDAVSVLRYLRDRLGLAPHNPACLECWNALARHERRPERARRSP
jgi:hypothetical protein